MKIKLNKLLLSNFKGIKTFEFIPDGKDITCYGDNGAGKTTLADGFAWLFTNKNSADKADFEIKELDSYGAPVLGVNHEVSAVLSGEEAVYTFKKVASEIWTKKRGTAQQTFTGHTVTYYVDDVPLAQKDYNARLTEIAPPEIIKILINPAYFNSLKWEKKRELLIDMAGDITMQDVIEQDKSFVLLPGIIGTHTLDEHKKVTKASQARINKDLDKIPARIDEIKLSMPDIAGIEAKKIKADIKTFQTQKTEAEKELFQLENGGDIAAKKQKLAELRANKIDLETAHAEAIQKDVANETDNFTKIEHERSILCREIEQIPSDISVYILKISAIEKTMHALRDEWGTVNATKADILSDTCPACNQLIPVNQLADLRKKEAERINTWKANDLARINKKGKELKANKEDYQTSLEKLQNSLKIKKEILLARDKDLAGMSVIIQNLKNRTLQTPEYSDLLSEETAIIKDIEDSKAGDTKEQAEKLTATIKAFESNIAGLQATLQKIKRTKQDTSRIKELESEEKTLAGDYEKLESEIFLLEAFIKKKVAMLEGSINDLFEITTFKMFAEQVNGGIKDTCVALFDGVPYDLNLNKAHRVKVGLDIIKTFSKHYNVSLPVFVDNFEGMTSIPDMDAQIIRLVKPEITNENREHYKQLTTQKSI